MSELFLVRHAQASLGHDNYDRLSELGHRQSRWLGEYFRERDIRFDRVFTGAMQRHIETARGIADAMDADIHGFDERAGWNEYDFMTLLDIYQAQNPAERLSSDADHKTVYRLLQRALHAWSSEALDLEGTGMESWSDFQCRVAKVLEETRSERGSNVLVVSSGGTLAVALQNVLGLANDKTIQLNLQTCNTALHRCLLSVDVITVSSFNNVPHLDTSERRQFITFA